MMDLSPEMEAILERCRGLCDAGQNYIELSVDESRALMNFEAQQRSPYNRLYGLIVKRAPGFVTEWSS